MVCVCVLMSMSMPKDGNCTHTKKKTLLSLQELETEGREVKRHERNEKKKTQQYTLTCITRNNKMRLLCVWVRLKYRAALCLVNVRLNDGVYIFFFVPFFRFVFSFHDFVLVLCFFFLPFFSIENIFFLKEGTRLKGDVVGSNHTT